MNDFKDYFSGHARQYAAARPSYPEALIDHIASCCDHHELAWDVATGNGQAARGLARHFDRVHATDASADQIAQAPATPGIDYRAEPAEQCSLTDGSTDLVTVAQAAHWFDHQRFYAEARRVLRPGGVIAVWCYGIHRVNPVIDPPVLHYYEQVVGDYWPPERRYIDGAYADLPFPFEPLTDPGFEMRCRWGLAAFLAYLRSWSATQRYMREHSDDPLEPLTEQLAVAWGDEVHEVLWPIHLKIARIQ